MTDSFEDFWTLYPKRAGGNSKADALRAWNARVRQGADPAALIAGVMRYAAFCAATDIIDSQFVKQARTFLGPGEHWTEDWTPPPPVKPKPAPREPIFPKPVPATVAPDVAANVDEQYATRARTSRRLPEHP